MTEPRPKPAAAFLKAALIVLAGVWIYGPALGGGWVWDDLTEIPQNLVLRDPHGLARIWAGSAGPDYFPLKTSLQWFLWRIWGDDPTGYHAVSLALHLACALLFWRLLHRLGLRLAWLGGILFVVHPLVVESVAWIAELKNTLSLALLLGAMIAYVAYDEGGLSRRRSYALSLLGFLLALLSKSSVVMFPFVILLYSWWRRGRITRRDLGSAAPFFGLSLVLGLVTVYFQSHRALAAWTVPVHGLAARVAVAGTSLAFYCWKGLLPFGLHPMYRQWAVEPPTPLEFLPWLAAGLILAWAWARRATWGRPVLLGFGFFLLNLVPVLGFLPMSYMHFSWVADHFAYLPLLGLIGLAVATVGALWRRLESGDLGLRLGFVGVVGVVALLLAYESRSDAATFRRDDVLWTHTLERNPDAWLAHVDLGKDLFQSGRLPEAIEQFNQALAIRTDLPEAYYNRGSTFLRLGRMPEAIHDLQETLRLQPDSPDAQTNLGNALARSGRFGEAIPHYEEALRLQPDATDARANLAEAHFTEAGALVERRRYPEAIAELGKAIEVRPDFAAAHAYLGNLLFVGRQFPEAIAQYEEALRIDPANAQVRGNLNLARRAQRDAAP
jgi:tetratricopeptide (TPR) repeat protein